MGLNHYIRTSEACDVNCRGRPGTPHLVSGRHQVGFQQIRHHGGDGVGKYRASRRERGDLRGFDFEQCLSGVS